MIALLVVLSVLAWLAVFVEARRLVHRKDRPLAESGSEKQNGG